MPSSALLNYSLATAAEVFPPPPLPIYALATHCPKGPQKNAQREERVKVFELVCTLGIFKL